ncbi:MAG: ABC transporter ATP-binding protein [Alphaproteobacteria bacterium]|nr:ABC transporter ATP-binding protein [Alphaproteobacteria bacterium]
MTALIATQALAKHYGLPRDSLWRPAPAVRAVDGVDLVVEEGRNFGVVGESGSGKSTLARLLLALERPTSGTVRLLDDDLFALSEPALRAARRQMQIVFQDPFGSLDPRLTVGRSIAEPIAALERSSAAEREERAVAALTAVGLKAEDRDKYPHEFSGGQRQRVAIARAIVTRPKLIVADEPVSALDVSVQAQILNLMQDLRESHGVTFVLISHDLSVVRFLCDDVAVMQRGRIVEVGEVERVLHEPREAYTRALIAAVPKLPRF